MTSSISRRDPRAPTFGPLSTVRYTVDGVDFDMVCVPPGRFVDGEGPTRRELLVSRPFELGVAPVTQALWGAVMGLSPSRHKGEDRPVEMVSWDDARRLMARLTKNGLPGFRLPTEAEWAWSARCGAPTRWAGADRAKAVAVTGSSQTAAVAGLSSSAVGTFDLSGNVFGWVGDGDGYEETPSAGVDRQGSVSGSRRVYRGGGWGRAPQDARGAFRGTSSPGIREASLGVRLARTLP